MTYMKYDITDAPTPYNGAKNIFNSMDAKHEMLVVKTRSFVFPVAKTSAFPGVVCI